MSLTDWGNVLSTILGGLLATGGGLALSLYNRKKDREEKIKGLIMVIESELRIASELADVDLEWEKLRVLNINQRQA